MIQMKLFTSKSLLTVLRIVYAIARLSSGKTMVSILHVDLISYRYFKNALYVCSCHQRNTTYSFLEVKLRRLRRK